MPQFWPQFPAENTRKSQYAGSWYEKNPDKLKRELDSYIDKAELMPDAESNERINVSSLPITPDLLAIIVPHAGFMFSGSTAAYAYKAAQVQKFKRIFLLGPSHHIGFRGAALPQASMFSTPLGDIEVATDIIQELKTYPLFSVQADVHRVEHSLELQLPFIKHCFAGAKIVPIVIGQLKGESEARLIGQVLKNFVVDGDLIIVSSDFTHYGPRYEYTPFGLGDDVPERVCTMDGEAYSLLSDLNLEGFDNFLKDTGDTICGMYPCQVLLSMLPKAAHSSLLKYSTSRESLKEDKKNSVSYLAVAFSGAEWPKAAGTISDATDLVRLNEADRQTLLTLAKKTIEVFVKENRTPSPKELGIQISESMKPCFGVFVTLSKKTKEANSTHKDLRGCIGSIYPTRPLYKAVQENAVAACSRDTRFSPVTENEIDDLTIDINVLTPPKRIANYDEIVIGRDGVILSKGRYQSVFLPQVAVEWGWTLEEMLTELALKAGLQANDWRTGCNFDVFQSEEIR